MACIGSFSRRELHPHCAFPSGGACRRLARHGKAQRKLHAHAPFPLPSLRGERRSVKICSSSNDMASNENEFDLSQYLLAEIATVRAERHKGDGKGKDGICQLEATGLIPDPQRRPSARPMTYDLMKNTLTVLGARVTKVCITALVDTTFHARLHCTKTGSTDELVLDARPSDALNLAVRYEAPIYINKAVADKMASPMATYESREEIPSEIEGMCREALKRYHDPTVVHKMNMQIAVEEDRFEDAAKIRDHIEHMLAGNRTFSLVVAMESALADKRWEECSFLCKELNKLIEAGDKGRA